MRIAVVQSREFAGGKPWKIPADCYSGRELAAQAKAERDAAALEAVRAGRVTYRYTDTSRPVTPQPVTARTLAFRVEGADGRTVRSLLNRGLVRMVALENMHGRFEAVPQDEDADA